MPRIGTIPVDKICILVIQNKCDLRDTMLQIAHLVYLQS